MAERSSGPIKKIRGRQSRASTPRIKKSEVFPYINPLGSRKNSIFLYKPIKKAKKIFFSYKNH